MRSRSLGRRLDDLERQTGANQTQLCIVPIDLATGAIVGPAVPVQRVASDAIDYRRAIAPLLMEALSDDTP